VLLVRNGSCGLYRLEPLVEVETSAGRVAYGPVSPDDVAALFDAGVLSGIVKHPLCLGPTDSVSELASQRRFTMARAGHGRAWVDPLDLADYEAHGGLKGLRAALAMEAVAICAAVTTSGLRGRVGAGFAAGIKWQTMLNRPADSGSKYIACNADEGNSGTFADRILMQGDPFALPEGMAIAGLATGAVEDYVYIRSEYPEAIRTMAEAISAMERAG